MNYGKVVNLKSSAQRSCNLQNYKNQRMECPVDGIKTCYFVPLSDIESFSHNPARSGGTLSTKVTQILESFISDPKGQIEPICLEWNPATGKFDIVFGCHREWAANDAYAKGLAIANHPITGEPGIWAWVFTGSPAERTALKMRENGDKLPSSPATKDEMVNMLREYISQGGLDIGYPTSFQSLSDKDKYDRARAFMKSNTPFWGGRKFKGVWNKLIQNGNPNVGLSFANYSKAKIAEYFCAHNPYGIKESDLDSKLSGSVVKINNVVYGIYFASQKSEMGGALPTNASLLRHNKNIDHMIVVGVLNDSTTATVAASRITIEKKAKKWNKNIFNAFDEIFWMPQTLKETSVHILKGTWVSRNTL